MNDIELLKDYVVAFDNLQNGRLLTLTEYEIITMVRDNQKLASIVKAIDSLPTKEEKLKTIYKYEASLRSKNQSELTNDEQIEIEENADFPDNSYTGEYINSKTLDRIYARPLSYTYTRQLGSIFVLIISFIAITISIITIILINIL